ncbi:MAG: EH signature domain-containing protein [Rhodoferax sp.]|uniref:EH signature domain-containing protein n=1 Tax=Rhodoferax sp. TaxID=50421 RepID=UPI00272467A3|nr:EH signature domain-containing protein [Rhodoferax sp.]MDO8450341.1 EH signature domain-containing protein [Rhodoferax sp.]
MNSLNKLEALLRPGTAEGARQMTVTRDIDEVLAEMEKRSNARESGKVPADHQFEAVRRFWDSQSIQSFRDAYQLSWGLCVPHRQGGPCILEDRSRFQCVLDGVGAWKSRPIAFRRCFQGLVKSYFTYDGIDGTAPAVGRQNWKQLRDYLNENTRLISDKHANPDWVATAFGNSQVFRENPCDPYVDILLRGDTSAIDHLCKHLGIGRASWFLRELVLAQVNGATKLGNAQFQALIPRLLTLLADNEVLRDRGLILVLDRYAKVPGGHLHPDLRDSSVLWWGNPWLPSNEMRWGGVTEESRSMVADWLKLEFIETFFTKLAEDGTADPRRMEFWKRYVKSIDHIQFALGSSARCSRERDFVVLRKKMAGLICELDASGTNNAFIMTMGTLVAVEFSAMGNALYGYDARTELPFNTTEPLTLGSRSQNSLKQKDKAILWQSHQDGIHGWDAWEPMFDATLHQHFGISPDAQKPRVVRVAKQPESVARPPVEPDLRATPQAFQDAADLTRPYTRARLTKVAKERGFQVDDKVAVGGSLWVRTAADDLYVTQLLTKWGFHHKPGKGWWK